MSLFRDLFVTTALGMASAMLFTSGADAAAFNPEKFEVAFGTAENSVMYYNSTIKDFEEPYPMGPSAFAVLGEDRIAVLDTFNGAIKIFDQSGKLDSGIDVRGLLRGAAQTDECHLSAMAFSRDQKGGYEFYAADSANGKVYVINGGKIVRSLGSFGDGQFEMVQIERLAVAPNGSVMAGDAKNNKIAVFSDLGVGVRETPWNFNGFAVDDKFVYTVETVAGGTFSFVRRSFSGDVREALFTVQCPGMRIPRIVGVDRFGGIVATFFEDAIQDRLMGARKEPAENGYLTVVSISPAGQMRTVAHVAVTVPLGDQFYFDRASDTLYYQDYDAGKAPAGKYRIARLKVDPTWAEASDKMAAEDFAGIKKSLTEIEYGVGAAKLEGSFGSQSALLPVLRSDGKGFLYLLDRVGKKIICIQQSLASLKTIEINYQMGGDSDSSKIGVDDMFAVSTEEIYLLDSRGRSVYRLAAKKSDRSAPASYDVSRIPLEAKEPGWPSAIFADRMGDLMVYSGSEGLAAHCVEGKWSQPALKIQECSIFTMPNSDILALAANAGSAEISLKYYDFNMNPMERFETRPSIAAAENVSAGRIFGVDSNGNIFTTFFDGKDQRVALFSMTGDAFCDFAVRIPQNYGYIASSLCVSEDGTIFAGVPRQSKYFIVRIPYSSIIDLIKANYMKKQK